MDFIYIYPIDLVSISIDLFFSYSQFTIHTIHPIHTIHSTSLEMTSTLPPFLDDFSTLSEYSFQPTDDLDNLDLDLDLDLGLSLNLDTSAAASALLDYPSPALTSASTTGSASFESVPAADVLDIDSLDRAVLSSQQALMMHLSPEHSIRSPTFYSLESANSAAAAAVSTASSQMVGALMMDSSPSEASDPQSPRSLGLGSGSSSSSSLDLDLEISTFDSPGLDLAGLLNGASGAAAADMDAVFMGDKKDAMSPPTAFIPSDLMLRPQSQAQSQPAEAAASPTSKPLRKQSESRISLPELYIRMGLGHDHEEARTREQRILTILRSEGFKLGEQTWIRDTTENDRRRIIGEIYEQTYAEYRYSRELIEVIVRRGSYYLMQGRLRRIRRSKKAMLSRGLI